MGPTYLGCPDGLDRAWAEDCHYDRDPFRSSRHAYKVVYACDGLPHHWKHFERVPEVHAGSYGLDRNSRLLIRLHSHTRMQVGRTIT